MSSAVAPCQTRKFHMRSVVNEASAIAEMKAGRKVHQDMDVLAIVARLLPNP